MDIGLTGVPSDQSPISDKIGQTSDCMPMIRYLYHLCFVQITSLPAHQLFDKIPSQLTHHGLRLLDNNATLSMEGNHACRF